MVIWDLFKRTLKAPSAVGEIISLSHFSGQEVVAAEGEKTFLKKRNGLHPPREPNKRARGLTAG